MRGGWAGRHAGLDVGEGECVVGSTSTFLLLGVFDLKRDTVLVH